MARPKNTMTGSTTHRRVPPTPPRRRPRPTPLPGLEDTAIQALDDAALMYAELRDERLELGVREAAHKARALALMKKHGRTSYRHAGVEISVIAGADELRVKIKRAEDDDDEPAPAVGAEFSDARQRAVED